MSFYIPSFEEYLALYGPDAGQLFPSPKVLTCWVKHLWLGAGGDLPKNLSRELSNLEPDTQQRFIQCLRAIGVFIYPEVGDFEDVTIGWVEGRLQGHTTNLTTSKSKMDQWLGHLQLRLLRLILEYARGSEASCIRPESGPGPGQKVEALISFLDLEQSSIVLSFKEHELRLLHGSIAFGSDTSQALALCRALGITNTDATLPTPTHINLGGKELLFYQSASPSSKIVTLVVSEELREDGEGVVAISEEGSSKLLFLSTCQPERIQLHTCQT